MAEPAGTSPRGQPQVIESYRGLSFRISGIRHAGSVLVLRDEAVAWPVTALEDIDIDALSSRLAAAGVELLLLGCGRQLRPVPPALRQGLKAHGVAVEPMDTGAACRTFNVLAGEERLVAAALIAIE